jgi:hypothetical protein
VTESVNAAFIDNVFGHAYTQQSFTIEQLNEALGSVDPQPDLTKVRPTSHSSGLELRHMAIAEGFATVFARWWTGPDLLVMLQEVKARAATLSDLDSQIESLQKIAESPALKQSQAMAAAIASLVQTRVQAASENEQAENNLSNRREAQREVIFTRVLAEMSAVKAEIHHQVVYGIIACALHTYMFQRAHEHLEGARTSARLV